MKLVIDIPDEDYNVILENANIYKEKQWGLPEVWDAIVNGTPLPKGHGDLIDRDTLIQKQFIPNVGFELIELDDLKTAPIVIPADK